MLNNAIIVADDSKLVKNIIKKALENEFVILEASNGKEVIDIINNKGNYNITGILLDLNMPYYNGYYVLDYFRTNNLVDKIPISIISGDDAKETINNLFNYKIVDILSKPFTQEQIKNIINKMTNFKNNTI